MPLYEAQAIMVSLQFKSLQVLRSAKFTLSLSAKYETENRFGLSLTSRSDAETGEEAVASNIGVRLSCRDRAGWRFAQAGQLSNL